MDRQVMVMAVAHSIGVVGFGVQFVTEMSNNVLFYFSPDHSPISESRRVLQESCEFFLKHNSRVQHKKKHYKSSSHKLKVISKSMGTSTGAAAASPAGHGVPSAAAVSAGNHEVLGRCSFSEVRGSSEASGREQVERGSAGRGSRRGGGEREPAGQAVPTHEALERRSKTGSSTRFSSRSESFQRVPDGR